MDDSIALTNLRVATPIGVTEKERTLEQTLTVSVELFTDTKKAGVSDAIEDTIDYDNVAKIVADLAKTERRTLEKFAEDIAAGILKSLKPKSVKISVSKPRIAGAEAATVTIFRP